MLVQGGRGGYFAAVEGFGLGFSGLLWSVGVGVGVGVGSVDVSVSVSVSVLVLVVALVVLLVLLCCGVGARQGLSPELGGG